MIDLSNLPEDLVAALQELDAATQRFLERDPASFKAMFSHGQDVTVAGGLGGIDVGWAAVGPRLDRVSAAKEPVQFEAERIAVHHSGDLAVVVQRERFRSPNPSVNAAASEYRTTMALRREAGAWRVVHRHADAAVSDRTPPPA